MRALALILLVPLIGCGPDPFGLQAAFGTPTHHSGPPPAHQPTLVDVEIYKDGALIDTIKSIRLESALATERLAKTSPLYCFRSECVETPLDVVIYGDTQ